LFRNWGIKYIKTKIEIARKRIEENGMQGEPKDMIEALVRANINSKSKNNEDFYSEEEILEEFSTFFVAGTDTTSHYVMTMIYLIAQNPEVEAKLR
jgi:cytochrome P450